MSSVADTVGHLRDDHGERATTSLVITANPADDDTAWFAITNIVNGTLFKRDGVTPILAT